MNARISLAFEQGTLVLDAADGIDREALAELLPAACCFDPRIQRFRAPAAAYRAIVTALTRSPGVELADAARAYPRLKLEPLRDLTPFAYQTAAIEAWQQAGGRGVVVLPTGAGKSYVAEMAMAAVGRAALVLAPTIDLMLQWQRQLAEAFGLEVGLLGGGFNDVRDLTVTTYDSAYLHMERLGARFGLLVFDEVHHLPGPSYAFAARCAIAPYRLGLTATPERADGGDDQYEELVGPIVFRKHIKELAGIHLSDYDVVQLEVELTPEERDRYAVSRQLYLDFVRQKRIRLNARGGWQQFLRETSRSAEGRRALMAHREQREVAQCCSSKVDTLGTLLQRHRDDRLIVFTHDNHTVYEISRRFLLPSLTHQTPPAERKEVLERFNSGRYPALVTSRVLNEGVNIPEANVAIVMSGSASVREHVQRLGRILRRKLGKHATLYELVARGTNEEFVSERRRDHDAYQ